MNWSEELKTAGEAAVSSPRLIAASAAATTSLGAANLAQIFQGALSTIAIIAGILATLLLSRKHWADYKNSIIQGKILTAQLEAMGVDPMTDRRNDS